ncbi:SAM-dependent methyltransferase [Balamuthia mandrillaris]
MQEAQEWDKRAKQYNATAGDLTIRHSAEALRLLDLGSLVGEEGREAMVVLDIACGTGAFAIQAAKELHRLCGGDEMKKGRPHKVIASDFAEAMVFACQAEAEQQGLQDHVQCLKMDAQDLSAIEDDSVDAIGCVFGAMFFPDPLKAFREMHRVLRKGGRAAIVVWKQVATLSLTEQLTKRLRERFLPASSSQGEEAAATSHSMAAMVYKLAEGETLRNHLEEAGFQQVDSVTTFEADWKGVPINDLTIGFMMDNHVVKSCYAPEQREEAVHVN